MDNEKNEKYIVIEPFFKKEKKLKDIEKETRISYATLKRWVSQYRTAGEKGLSKKTRADKDTFKKINEDTLNKLKLLYKEYHNLPVTKIYEKAKKTILSYNSMISYPTFFRIINNLDENIKQNSIGSLKKERIYEYGIVQKAIPLPFFHNKNKIFYLTIFYNKQNYKMINFLFEEKKRDLKKLFNFIRESIIIEGAYPKNLSLDNNIEGCSKTLFRKIYFETKINLLEEELDSNIIGLLKYLDTDILKEFKGKKPKKLNSVDVFIRKYLFIEKDEAEELAFEELKKLQYFFSKYKRKVYNSGIRVKNNIYNTPLLKEYEGKIIDVFYSEFRKEFVDLYFKETFIDYAKLIKEY
ncbi:MAG: helix-turn-helix domain-containing protein [Cetobacterium sp.]